MRHTNHCLCLQWKLSHALIFLERVFVIDSLWQPLFCLPLSEDQVNFRGFMRTLAHFRPVEDNEKNKHLDASEPLNSRSNKLLCKFSSAPARPPHHSLHTDAHVLRDRLACPIHFCLTSSTVSVRHLSSRTGCQICSGSSVSKQTPHTSCLMPDFFLTHSLSLPPFCSCFPVVRFGQGWQNLQRWAPTGECISPLC